MFSFRILLPSVLLLMGFSLSLISVRPAAALSAGCTRVDGLVLVTGSLAVIDYDFEAGERLIVTISNPQSDTTIQLEVDGIIVDSAPLLVGQSAVLQYVFAADGIPFLRSSSGVSATHAWECVSAPATPTPTPPSPSPSPTAPAPARPEIGPGIPDGFVLRTMFCDTPLFTLPDGIPVPGGAAVTTGQTWFVAPIEESPGWIEGFFGGYRNAWLPAACMG